MKTHYDWASRKKNEASYTRTLCGKKDYVFNLITTLKTEDVSCKNCLKMLNIKP